MRLRFEHTVPAPRDAVFRFHSDPKNLGVLLANRKGFRLIAHEGHVRPGAVTRIVDSIGPLPIAITFEHVSFEPPSAFEERMVHGPFERFVHRHEFHDRGGTTHVVDLLDVRLPPWLGGELVDCNC
jgi:ligand-binding SRPBCC domain-containing protein